MSVNERGGGGERDQESVRETKSAGFVTSCMTRRGLDLVLCLSLLGLLYQNTTDLAASKQQTFTSYRSGGRTSETRVPAGSVPVRAPFQGAARGPSTPISLLFLLSRFLLVPPPLPLIRPLVITLGSPG